MGGAGRCHWSLVIGHQSLVIGKEESDISQWADKDEAKERDQKTNVFRAIELKSGPVGSVLIFGSLDQAKEQTGWRKKKENYVVRVNQNIKKEIENPFGEQLRLRLKPKNNQDGETKTKYVVARVNHRSQKKTKMVRRTWSPASSQRTNRIEKEEVRLRGPSEPEDQGKENQVVRRT